MTGLNLQALYGRFLTGPDDRSAIYSHGAFPTHAHATVVSTGYPIGRIRTGECDPVHNQDSGDGLSGVGLYWLTVDFDVKRLASGHFVLHSRRHNLEGPAWIEDRSTFQGHRLTQDHLGNEFSLGGPQGIAAPGTGRDPDIRLSR